MKPKFQFMWVAVLIAFASAFAFSAFDKPNTTYTSLTEYVDGNGNITTLNDNGDVVSGSSAFAGTNIPRIYALDTMSAAGTTYITPGWNLSSPYQYSYFFRMRKLVGTPNVKIRLEQKNCSNSAIWSAIDSVTVGGADSTKLHFRLQGSVLYGSAHRIAFVKTGTNTIARNVELMIKGTN